MVKIKIKYIIAFVLTIFLSAAFPYTVFAADSLEASPITGTTEAWKHKSEKHELSQKQKEEMETKRKEFQAKWDSLSPEQKEEIYKIKEKCFDNRIEMIDQYLEFGVIDKETAIQMKNKIEAHKSDMRKNGAPVFIKLH